MIPLRDDEPTNSVPFVTFVLIAINAFVFAGWQLNVGLPESVALAALIPAELTIDAPAGVTHMFTSMFMHGGWMHLIGNMWFLWIFGNNIEDACGPFRFIAFYLLCGVVAAFAHILAAPQSAVPLVGASGAVSGVLGAYLLRYPRATVTTLIPLGIFTRIVHIPAAFFLLFWIAMQIFSQWAMRSPELAGGGVAYLAHIGGFIAGLVLIFLFQKEPPRRRKSVRERSSEW